MKFFRNIAFATFAFFGSTLAATAATLDLAELNIDGTTGAILPLVPGTDPGFITLGGAFDGDFADDIFDYDTYIFGGSLDVNGTEIFSGSIAATKSQIVDFLTDLSTDPDAIFLANLVDDLLNTGALTFNITSFVQSPTDNSFSGTYFTSLSADLVSPDVVSLFASGQTFDIALSVSTPVSVVPLPAGGLLLLTGLGAIGLMRRRKTAA